MIYVVNVDIEVEANNPIAAEDMVLDALGGIGNPPDFIYAVRGVEAIA